MESEYLRENCVLFRIIFFFALFLTAPSFAHEQAAPLRIEGGRVISVDEAKAIFDSGKALFIDVRNPLNFGRGHIPSAIAMPFDGKEAGQPEKSDFRKKLPVHKGASIVFYSHGPTGWKSYRAALEAIRAGYGNVMWMREGLEGWRSKGYPISVGPEADLR